MTNATCRRIAFTCLAGAVAVLHPVQAAPVVAREVVIAAWPDRPEIDAEFTRDVPAKQQALKDLRAEFVAHPPRVSPEAKDLAKVRSYFGLLGEDGRFGDLQKPAGDDWAVALRRLNPMSAAFAKLSAAERTASRAKLIKAITFYCRYAVAHPDPFTESAFTAPRNAVAIYFSLDAELQSPDAADAVAALKDCVFCCWYCPVSDGDTRRKTDPYHLDVFLRDTHFIVGNTTYRPIVECAVMLNDTKLMDIVHAITIRSLQNRTAYPIESNTLWGEQGMTMDGNGFAHGRQSYLFGYVADWFNGVCKIAQQFRGTPWEIPNNFWDDEADLTLDGRQWYVYHDEIDWSVNGRHNMYPGPIGTPNKALTDAVAQLLDVSQGNLKRKVELIALRDRLAAKQEFDGNRWFWNAEDMIQRRSDYYLSANLSSNRSSGPESAEPYSMVNYFMAKGAMMIKTRGDEYQAVRGALNYAALPGITSDPLQPLPGDQSWTGFPGESPFCGGVSDGKIGACAFVLKQSRFPVVANKGYFFFDDIFVALGAGVTTGNVETTINQTAWADNACYANGDGHDVAIATGGTDLRETVAQPRWFWNDGVGYLILPGKTPATARLRTEQRQTHWAQLAKIDADRSDAAPADVRVFQLSIAQVGGADTYAYAVMPNIAKEKIAAAASGPPFEILSNTPSVQAVRHHGDNVLQAIFYDAATLHFGNDTLAVDRPAVIQLQQQGDVWKLRVSDPLQRDPAGIMQVSTSLPVAGDSRSADGVSLMTCPLPEGPQIGSSVERTFPATRVSGSPLNTAR